MPLRMPEGRIFDIALSDPIRRDQIISNGLTRIAKKYAKQTKDDMVFGSHSGIVYKSTDNSGYQSYHQASARFEHPAPVSFNLVNSVTDSKLDKNNHEVFVDGGKAPYGDYLERPRLERHIMHPSDVEKFENGEMVGEIQRMRDQLTEQI